MCDAGREYNRTKSGEGVSVQPTNQPPPWRDTAAGAPPRRRRRRRRGRRRRRRSRRGAAAPHAAADGAGRVRLRAAVARRDARPGGRGVARGDAEVPRHGEQPARILLLLLGRGRGRRVLLRRHLVAVLLRGRRLRRDPRPERGVLLARRHLALPRVGLRLRRGTNPQGEVSAPRSDLRVEISSPERPRCEPRAAELRFALDVNPI